MINNISIRNFKALKEIDLELTNLNILTGINGMGKSSLIQTLLLLRQSYLYNNKQFSALFLSERLCNVGLGKDALYQYSEDDTIEFRLVCNYKEYVFPFESKPSFKNLPLIEKRFGFFEIPENLKESNMPYKTFSNLIDRQNLTKFPALESFNEINLFNNNFQYLTAEHIGPRVTYPRSGLDEEYLRSIDIKGETTIEYLSSFGNRKIKFTSLQHINTKTLILIRQVEAWLSEICPVIKISTVPIPADDKILLSYSFETKDDFTDDYKPMNVGFGITYALPVIVALLTAEKDKLIILENPEAHLHPRGQSKIGELIALAAQGGAQILVETHSDHIINGIRLATKKKQIDSDKIKLYYFDRKIDSKEHYSFAHDITINQDGRFNEGDWPDGFLDEWDKNLMELL